MTILEGEQKRLVREFDAARAVAHQLGNLVAFAFHDPKHMPRFEPTPEPGTERTDEADQAKVRAHLILLAGGKKKIA